MRFIGYQFAMGNGPWIYRWVTYLWKNKCDFANVEFPVGHLAILPSVHLQSGSESHPGSELCLKPIPARSDGIFAGSDLHGNLKIIWRRCLGAMVVLCCIQNKDIREPLGATNSRVFFWCSKIIFEYLSPLSQRGVFQKKCEFFRCFVFSHDDFMVVNPRILIWFFGSHLSKEDYPLRNPQLIQID